MASSPSEIIIIGALGTRFDHTLANIHLLRKACTQQMPCSIVDDHNEIRLTDSSMQVSTSGFRYISLLPLTLEVTGVTLEGFQYPLNDATLTLGKSLAISNELTSTIGNIRIKSGLLLVIHSKD